MTSASQLRSPTPARRAAPNASTPSAAGNAVRNNGQVGAPRAPSMTSTASVACRTFKTDVTTDRGPGAALAGLLLAAARLVMSLVLVLVLVLGRRRCETFIERWRLIQVVELTVGEDCGGRALGARIVRQG